MKRRLTAFSIIILLPLVYVIILYFTNKAILLPQFGGENEESDRRAVKILSDLCKDRVVIPVPARDIIVGGGNIHCITQQIPAVGKN